MANSVGPGVYVTNLREVRGFLRKVHPDLVPVLRDELKTAVNVYTVPTIAQRVPRKTGNAASNVRARSGGNTVYIVAGTAKAPYFGWLDFGGMLKPTGDRRNFIFRPMYRKGRYVYAGIAATGGQLVKAAGNAVDRAIQSALR